jgi:hypothetical protein
MGPIFSAITKATNNRVRFSQNRRANGFVVSILWHELIVELNGCHRGIYLMRYKGSHKNRLGTVPVLVLR